MVANDQAGRNAGLWLTPHELEKEFNAAKRVNPSLAFVNRVSKFVAQGACRNYRNTRSQGTDSPQTCLPQKEPHRRGVVPGHIRRGRHQVRRPPADPIALPGQRADDPPPS